MNCSDDCLGLTYYKVSSFAINALSLVYMIVYVPGAFFASWIVDSRRHVMPVIFGCLTV